ncbi:MAG: exo-alpha-sialidase, partial [Blastocatellia bacterium]|nr:exo-alpha-sialidase [Blastocatellia bacterium]
MKNFRPRSFTRWHAAIIVVMFLAFVSMFSISRISARQDDEENEGAKVAPTRMLSEQIFGPFDYDAFLEREKAGEFPFQGGAVPGISPYNSLTNNNAGSTGTGFFTQSETTLTAFGNTVVVGFNDSGSNSGGTNKFTGFARSTDGGATFTDGGALPTNPNGDVGDPVLARNEATGRIYLSTLQFSGDGVRVFRSDDNGATWGAPVQGAPGKSGFQDKEWITVDNFAGAGNGNVYLVARDFGAGNGIYFFRSTDNGDTYGPSGGALITSGNQGAFVAVGPDHAVYVFWWAVTSIQMRKSTDQGLTFGAPVTVASGLVGGTNGDLGLTGVRQGTTTASGFRSSEFPHAAVNPVNGNIYATFANNPAGVDKADVFVTQSTDGGVTWAAPIRVNDDATTTDQWQPTLAVTPDGANLGVF